MDQTQINFTGRLSKDPEIRFSPAGDPFCRIRVAVNRRIKRDDEWIDGEPTWWDAVANGALAENIHASLRKGDPVQVTGHVITELGTDGDGEERRYQKVRARTVSVPLNRHTAVVRKAVPPKEPNDDTAPREDQGLAETDTEAAAVDTGEQES